MDDRLNIFESQTTPAGAVALEVLIALRKIWVELWHVGDEDELFEFIIEPMAKDPTLSGEENSRILDELAEATESDIADELKSQPAWDDGPVPANAKVKCTEYALFETACEFAVQAIRAQATKAPEELKWKYACEAKHFLGILQGYISGTAETSQISAMAKRGADARHAENRAMKAQLFDWCAKHLSTFKSLDAAAFAVVQTQMPIAFRTARSWIGEWKKLQSAGTL
ncbi:MAG: hypothetical protein ACJ8LG_22820 [Massilia sp.]